MAIKVSITLQGAPDTVRKLNSLPRKVAKRVLRKAVNAGAGPYVKTARAKAPRRSGLFVKSLATKIKVYAQSGTIVALIGQEKSAGWQKRASKVRQKIRLGVVRSGGISARGDLVPIHLVENPTRPHRIPKEVRKTPLQIRMPNGLIVSVAKVDHPGTRGSKFLERTYQDTSAAASAKFEAKLAQEIDREAATAAEG